MLTIRDRQIPLLGVARREAFEDRLVARLHERFPAQPDLRGLVQYGIERARAYDIVGGADVCSYVILMCERGRDFDRQPWAAAILDDPATQGRGMLRANLLCDAAREVPVE